MGIKIPIPIGEDGLFMEITIDKNEGSVDSFPKDWKAVLLPDLLLSTSDPIKIGPFGSALKKELLKSKGYKVYGQQNIYDQNMELGDRYISSQYFKELKTFEIFPGDFLISMMGTVGKCFIVPDNIEPGIMDSHLIRLKIDPQIISAAFLSHLFRSPIINFQIKQLSVGGIMEGLSSKIIRAIHVPIPPTLAEQHAIAEALNDMDVYIESLEQLIAKKRLIKQGAMQELLTGRRRLPGFDGKWVTKQLGKLATITRGASPRPIDNPNWFDDNSSTGWVRISDVTKSDIFLFETSQRLSPQGIMHSRPVARNSLIMSICATVGYPIITKIDICIHDGFVVFEHLFVDQLFLYYVLRNIENDWTKSGQTGSQMNLNTGLINRTEVQIPNTIDEQSAIANVFFEMDTEINALEDKLDKARQIKQGMMQELLTGRIRLV